MAKVVYSKPALSYNDQLQRLTDRGLIIENPDKALHLLSVISYYRFSGYLFPFLQNKTEHRIKPNATFNKAFNLYKFDRELRLLVISEIEKIEIALRSRISNTTSCGIEPFWYTNKSNFKDISEFRKTLKKIRAEYKRADNDFIKSFKTKYSNSLPPSWMMMEIISFGSLSNLYKNLRPSKEKREIADSLGISDGTLISWLHSLTYIRNICAHHSRLWNKALRISPQFPKKTNQVWLNDVSIRNDRTYYILSIILYLLNLINPNHSTAKKLRKLLTKYPNIDLKAMGFPDDWKSEPLWEKESFKTIINKIFSIFKI